MKRILPALAAVLALAGCSAFYVEADQPHICLGLQPQTFLVNVPAGQTDPVDIPTTSVPFNLGDVIPSVLLSGSSNNHVLRFQSISMTIEGAPGVNFGFLENLQVEVQRGVLAPVVLADYTRGTGTPGASISMESLAPGENLTDFLQGGSIDFLVNGTLDPTQWPAGASSFSASVTACFSAKVKKTVQEMIDGT